MAWVFGVRSQAQLGTCHPKLVAVATEALRLSYFDFSVLKGHRDQAEQDAAFAAGTSQKRWPNGSHNRNPSLALDFAPWPRPFSVAAKDHVRWYSIAEAFWAASVHLGTPIRLGLDWDRDQDVLDQTFDDLGHVELFGPVRAATRERTNDARTLSRNRARTDDRRRRLPRLHRHD